MSRDYSQDVIAIREWMSKESHMPQDFDDVVLKKFLHSCRGSLAKTKKCLDSFCSRRSQLSEFFSSRDPLAPNLQTAFSLTLVTVYEFDKHEIIIHKYDDMTLDKYCFYDILKTVSMLFDHYIKYRRTLPERHYLIADLAGYSLKMIPKINIMLLRDFVIYLVETMPLYMKNVFVVNCPSYYDKLFAVIKPVLPAESSNIIHTFTDYEGLHQFIDKKYLPNEYGGAAGSMRDRNKQWLQKIKEDRDFFLNDNLWKADLKKKPKDSGHDDTMNGSFRSLSID